MKKKKFGLVTWSILAIVTTLLTCAGFVFGFVKEGIALYHSGDLTGMFIVDFQNFFRPIIDGFTTHFVPTSIVMYVLISYLAVVGVILLALVIVAGARKNAKYLWHIIPLAAIATIGLYLISAIGVAPAGEKAVCLRLLDKEGPLAVALFAQANYIQCAFGWLCAVGGILAVITTIGYVVMTFARAGQKHEKPVVEEETKVVAEVKETPAPVAEPTIAAPVIAAEPVEEPTEKPTQKKKVFLVVKRYNASENAIEEVEPDKENKALTAEEIREIVRKEQEAFEARKEEKCSCKSEPEVKCCEKTTNASVCTTNETRTCAPTPVKKEEKAPVTPIIIAIPDPVTDEDEAPVKKVEPAKPSITREQIRDIVRDELKRAIEEIIKVPQEPVEETVEEVVEETPAPVAEPTETIAVLNTNNVPVNVEEPVAEEPKPASEPVERIAFAERMRNADPEMKENYNRIKSLLMSYGLKNRVSNGGDAFRLHKVTYAKICVAGKSLKIYLALDPADYKNSTLPIKDASSKAMYKEIPLVFKIKSGLSMRRCEQLISEMMDKHGLEQVDRVEIKDYVALLDENTDDEE